MTRRSRCSTRPPTRPTTRGCKTGKGATLQTQGQRAAGAAGQRLLAQAVEAYDAALGVWTLEGDPADFRNTQLNKAWLALAALAAKAREAGDREALRRAYERADAAFMAARRAQAELGWLESDALGTSSLRGQHHSIREMYVRHARCLVQLGELQRAVVALEAGRAQALAQTQAIAGAALEGLEPEEVAAFAAARAQLEEARQGGSPAAVRAAHAAFLAVRLDIRGRDKDHLKHADFLPDEPEWADVARAAAPDQALVYLAATDFGGLALLVAPSGSGDPEQREPVLLELAQLTWRVVDDWLVRPDAAGAVVGGWRFALDHRALPLLATWLDRLEEQRGKRARVRRESQPLQTIPQTLKAAMPTLHTAYSRVIRTWRDEANRPYGDSPEARRAETQQLRSQLQQRLGAALLAPLLLDWLRGVQEREGAEEVARLLALPLSQVAEALPSDRSVQRAALRQRLQQWRDAALRLGAAADAEAQKLAREIQTWPTRSLAEALDAGLLESDLTAALNWQYTVAELELVLPELSRVVMQPLRDRLDALGLGNTDQPVALIACGRLGALPLHAAQVRGARDNAQRASVPFQDTCELAYQASARSLRTSRDAVAKLPKDGPFLTIGDPPTANIALPAALREALEIAHIAYKADRKKSMSLVGKEATLAKVLDLLRLARSTYLGAWVDIATHGSADPSDPSRCYMVLADDDWLTLALLQRERILEGVRCIGAAGCVTNVGDLETAPDELSSFAGGTLQAGAAGALATQWSVSDSATYLLMLRFAREALDHPAWAPARALREAAKWLRSATTSELDAFQKETRKGMPQATRDGSTPAGRAPEPPARQMAELVGARRDALRTAVMHGAPLRDWASVSDLITARSSDELRQKGATSRSAPSTTDTARPYDHPIFWASMVVYGA